MAAAYSIRQIEPGDILSGLSLGDAAFQPLKTFLQRHAANYHKADLGKTYGAFLDEQPTKAIGYVTLVCGEIAAFEELKAEEDFPYLQFPALKIARLAVDRRHRTAGIGYQLVLLAIGVAKAEISPRVGCRFVVVDSKRQSVEFYRRQGFTLLDTADNRARETPIMFLDLNKHE